MATKALALVASVLLALPSHAQQGEPVDEPRIRAAGDTAPDIEADTIAPGPYHAANTLMLRLLKGLEGPAHQRILLRFGAAEQLDSPAAPMSREMAEASLITGRNGPLCDAADLPHADAEGGFWNAVRAYCLAGALDPRAPIVLDALRERARIDPLTASLLRAMIDEAFLPTVETGDAEEMTPLRIAAIGVLELPLPADAGARIPLALTPALLEASVEEQRVDAAERLEQSGVMPSQALQEQYLSIASPDPGSRAAIAQALQGEAQAASIAAALREARKQAPSRYPALARAIGGSLAALPLQPLSTDDAAPITEALLLAGEHDAAWRWWQPQTIVDHALRQLVDRDAPAVDRQALEEEEGPRAAMLAAALGAFESAAEANTPQSPLTALASLTRAPGSLVACINALRGAKLDEEARAIALEAALLVP